MTYEEARRIFNLKAKDTINLESTKRLLEHNQRVLKGYLSDSLRKDFELETEALEILIAYEEKKNEVE